MIRNRQGIADSVGANASKRDVFTFADYFEAE